MYTLDWQTIYFNNNIILYRDTINFRDFHFNSESASINISETIVKPHERYCKISRCKDNLTLIRLLQFFATASLETVENHHGLTDP